MARVFSGTTRTISDTARTPGAARTGRAQHAARAPRPAHLSCVRAHPGSRALPAALAALTRGSACLQMLGCGVALALAAWLALGAPSSVPATAREASHGALPAGTIGVGAQTSTLRQGEGG